MDLTNRKDFGDIWADAFPKQNTDPASHMRILWLVKTIRERSVLFAQSYDEFTAKLHDTLTKLKISEVEFAEVEGEIAALKTSNQPFPGQDEGVIPNENQMNHGPSLRIVGQSLEVAKLPAFEVDLQDADYVVSGNSLTKTGEWILRHALNPHDFSVESARPPHVSRSVRFSATDISRLDDQARKQRRIGSTSQQMFGRLSQLLRALGDHLDQSRVSAFHISWSPALISVDFQSLDGQSDSRTFTTERLQQLGANLRFRRSRTTGYNIQNPKRLTDR